MNTFSLVQSALDASAKETDKDALTRDVIETGRIVQAVQTVVDALTPPEGGRYIVGFADISTAGTSLGERRITVSNKPLHDATLSMVEKAVVIATFAAHEIGHTLVTAPRKGAAREHNAHTGYHAVANLADDIILEPVMVDRFPILADAFEFTGLWVLRTTSKELPKHPALTAGMTTPERFNILLQATRYGDIPEIVWSDAAAITDREWSRAWAERLKRAKLNDQPRYLALVDEAWVRIRSDEDVPEPDEPEPEPGEGPEGEDEPEPKDEKPEPHEGEGPPGQDPNPDWDDDDAEEGDDDGQGEGEGDESEDGEGDEPDDGEGDEGEGDADGEGDESDGTTDSGESMEGADESDAEGDGDDDGDAESDEDGDIDDNIDGEGGGGNPEAVRPETDWSDREVEESMHDSAETNPYDWRAKDLDDKVRTYASSTVTRFGRHGKIATTWS